MKMEKGLHKQLSELLEIPLSAVKFVRQNNVERILAALKNAESIRTKTPTTTRPMPKYTQSERRTQYRRDMAQYILQATSIELPVRSNIPVTFYESIAQYLDLP